jgi:lysophospholipase L1-like esterase
MENNNQISRRGVLGGGALLTAGAVTTILVGGTPANAATRPRTLEAPPEIPDFTYGPNDPIRPFYEARSQYKNRKISIGILGDSYVESADASSIEAGYPAQLRNMLREEYPTGAIGGLDYIAARHQMAWRDGVPKYQAFNFNAEVVRGSQHGLGRRNVPLTPEVGIGTREAVFSSIKIAWWSAAKGNAIRIKIDNDPWVTVTADMVGERTWTSRQYDGTQIHTVQVGLVSGRPEFEGAWLFNGDENRGFHVLEGGNSGMAAWQLSKGAHPEGVSTWVDATPRFEFDLWMPETLINDLVVRTPAQVEKDMISFIRLIRTKSNKPILIAPPYERSTCPLPGTSWVQYTDALARAAKTDKNTDFFNMSNYIPRLAGVNPTPDTWGWMGPKGHPSDAGYNRMAQVLFKKLTATPNF